MATWESDPTTFSWRQIVSSSAPVVPHPDHHAFAFDTDGTVHEGDDGGVWRFTPAPFDPGVTYLTDRNPVSIAAAAFVPNADLDLAVAARDSSMVDVFLGNGDGSFPQLPDGYSLNPGPQPGGQSPTALVIGDFNSDTDPDIATANFDTSNASILLNTGQGGTFPTGIPTPIPPTYAAGPGPQSIATADFNNDGALDLVVRNPVTSDLSVLWGNTVPGQRKGDGTFAAGVALGNNLDPTAVAVGQLNNDRVPDIVVANGGSLNNVAVFVSNGDKTFKAPTFFPAGNMPTAVAVADVNGDSIPDIIVANSGAGTISVLLGNAAGGFGAPIVSQAGPNPVSLAVADFNNDGKMDVVVANRSANTVSVLYGNRDGTFQPPVSYYSGGQFPMSVTTGDFNGDGRPDIAVVNSGSNDMAVLLSNSTLPLQNTSGTWTDLNTTGLSTIQLNSVAQASYSRDRVLGASQDNGVALTTNATNANATWNTVNGGDGSYVRFDPNNTGGAGSNFAYATAYYGLFFRSDDGGQTWVQKTTNLPGTGVAGTFPFVTKFALDPMNPQAILIGANSQVFETTNRGDTWNMPALGGFLDNSGVTALAYAPSNDNFIYVGFADGRVFMTANHGGNWPEVTGPNPPWSPGPLGNPITSIVVDPNNPLLVYMSVGVFNKSQIVADANGGANGWSAITTGLPNVPVNALALDATGANLYAGNDYGVYTTSTGTINWTAYGTGLPNAQVADLQLQKIGASTFLAAATHGRGAWAIDPPTSDKRRHGHGSPDFQPPNSDSPNRAVPSLPSAPQVPAVHPFDQTAPSSSPSTLGDQRGLADLVLSFPGDVPVVSGMAPPPSGRLETASFEDRQAPDSSVLPAHLSFGGQSFLTSLRRKPWSGAGPDMPEDFHSV